MVTFCFVEFAVFISVFMQLCAPGKNVTFQSMFNLKQIKFGLT